MSAPLDRCDLHRLGYVLERKAALLAGVRRLRGRDRAGAHEDLSRTGGPGDASGFVDADAGVIQPTTMRDRRMHADPHLEGEPLLLPLLVQSTLDRHGAVDRVRGVCERDEESI